MDAPDQLKKEVNILQQYNAPPQLVFKAWTDAEMLKQWWGPAGFTNPVCEIDVRPGGAILIHMQAPDGTVYPMTGTFEEVVAPHRLVFTSQAVNTDGSELFDELTTVLFTEEDGKTITTLQSTITNIIADVEIVTPMINGMQEGWQQSFDRLTNLLSTNQ